MYSPAFVPAGTTSMSPRTASVPNVPQAAIAIIATGTVMAHASAQTIQR